MKNDLDELSKRYEQRKHNDVVILVDEDELASLIAELRALRVVMEAAEDYLDDQEMATGFDLIDAIRRAKESSA